MSGVVCVCVWLHLKICFEMFTTTVKPVHNKPLNTVHTPYKKLDGTWIFPYMRVFLYPSLLNKEDVWPGTKKFFYYKHVFFYVSF
jgi:hypothetical protein